MGKLTDELSERARRIVQTRGEVVAYQADEKTGILYQDKQIWIQLFHFETDGEFDQAGTEYLQLSMTQLRGFVYQERNGVPIVDTFQFSNEIAVAVRHLRKIMVLEDMADGRDPDESILRNLEV